MWIQDGELGDPVIVAVDLLDGVLSVSQLLEGVGQVLNKERRDIVVGDEVFRKTYLQCPRSIDGEVYNLWSKTIHKINWWAESQHQLSDQAYKSALLQNILNIIYLLSVAFEE